MNDDYYKSIMEQTTQCFNCGQNAFDNRKLYIDDTFKFWIDYCPHCHAQKKTFLEPSSLAGASYYLYPGEPWNH